MRRLRSDLVALRDGLRINDRVDRQVVDHPRSNGPSPRFDAVSQPIQEIFDAARHLLHPLHGFKHRPRCEKKPGINISVLKRADPEDIAIGVSAPRDRNRNRRFESGSPDQELLKESSPDSPIPIDKWVDHFELGMSQRRQSHGRQIGPGTEANQILEQTSHILRRRRNVLRVPGPEGASPDPVLFRP